MTRVTIRVCLASSGLKVGGGRDNLLLSEPQLRELFVGLKELPTWNGWAHRYPYVRFIGACEACVISKIWRLSQPSHGMPLCSERWWFTLFHIRQGTKDQALVKKTAR